jgi:hypothetical protein
VLSTTLAAAILVAWSLDCAIGDRPKASVLACLLIAMCFLANFVQDERLVTHDAATLRDVCRFLEATDPGLPVLIADPLLFFRVSHYAPPSLAARLMYLADVKIATDRIDTDTIERGLIALKEIAPLRVVSYRSFLSSSQPFLVYASPGYFSWLVPQLAENGAKLEISHVRSEGLLYLVTVAGSGNR